MLKLAKTIEQSTSNSAFKIMKNNGILIVSLLGSGLAGGILYTFYKKKYTKISKISISTNGIELAKFNPGLKNFGFSCFANSVL